MERGAAALQAQALRPYGGPEGGVPADLIERLLRESDHGAGAADARVLRGRAPAHAALR